MLLLCTAKKNWSWWRVDWVLAKWSIQSMERMEWVYVTEPYETMSEKATLSWQPNVTTKSRIFLLMWSLHWKQQCTLTPKSNARIGRVSQPSRLLSGYWRPVWNTAGIIIRSGKTCMIDYRVPSQFKWKLAMEICRSSDVFSGRRRTKI